MKAIVTVLALSIVTFTSCNGAEEKVAKIEEKVEAVVAPVEKEIKTISLNQIDGEFKQKTLTLEEGTYVFEINNDNVDHEVGFVLAPKGKTDAENHIKEAYVTTPVKTGSASKTSEVTLAKGEYVYFCPLNPTPEYSLVVN